MRRSYLRYKLLTATKYKIIILTTCYLLLEYNIDNRTTIYFILMGIIYIEFKNPIENIIKASHLSKRQQLDNPPLKIAIDEYQYYLIINTLIYVIIFKTIITSSPLIFISIPLTTLLEITLTYITCNEIYIYSIYISYLYILKSIFN